MSRLKDAITQKLFKPPTVEDQIDTFVYYLRSKLWVITGEGTVTIGIEFPDPDLAYRLVDAALQNFLEARHAADVSSIAHEQYARSQRLFPRDDDDAKDAGGDG